VPPLRFADRGVDMAQVFVGAISGDQSRHSFGTTHDVERSGSQGNWK